MSVTHLPTRSDPKEIERLYDRFVDHSYAFVQFKDLLTCHPEGHHFDSVYDLLVNHHLQLMKELQDLLPVDKTDF